MATINKKQFRALAAVKGDFCVSMYLPVHRSGMDVINKKDALVFKNQLKLVSEELIRRGMTTAETTQFLQPAQRLHEDPGFWRYQKEGLAVFLARDFVESFNLPFTPRPYTFISHEFYLKPLIPAFSSGGKFYLLAVNLHHIALFKGNREKLTEIYVQDITPQRLEEVVGTDYKERSHQLHSQQTGHGKGAVFHGHGEWKGEFRKEEILRFFRTINKTIVQRIADLKAPLLFAGVDYLFPIYQEINSYQHLMAAHIGRNPEDLSIKELHAEAWPKVFRYFDEERLTKIREYGNFQETERTSFEIAEIIPAAIAGRVDTLFVDEAAEVWGVYDPSSDKVTIHEEQRIINTSLLNLLIKEVMLNKGRVYLQSKETLPQSFSPVNALYRY